MEARSKRSLISVAELARRAEIAKAELVRYLNSPRGISESTRVAGRFFASREDVEDAIMEAASLVSEKGSQFDPTLRFAPWFLRILAMACLGILRKRKVRPRTVSLDNSVDWGGSEIGQHADGLMYLDAIPDSQAMPVADQAISNLVVGSQRRLLGDFSAESSGSRDGLEDTMLQCLLYLPRIHRDVLVMLYLDELSREQVAEQLGYTVGVVISLRDAALQQMRQYMAHALANQEAED